MHPSIHPSSENYFSNRKRYFPARDLGSPSRHSRAGRPLMELLQAHQDNVALGTATLRRAGFLLLVATCVLLAIGFLGIVSGELLDYKNSPTFHQGALKRLMLLAAGIACGVAFAALPMRRLRGAIPFLYVASCLLLVCCFIPSLGVEAGGSRRWIDIPVFGMRIQPSELAKPTLVLALASFLSRSWFKRNRLTHSTLIPAILVIPPITLIAAEVDLGYAALLVAVVLILLFLRGVSLFHVSILTAIGFSMIAMGTWSIPNRRSRIEAFLNLNEFAAESGYQQWRSVDALKRAASVPTVADSPGIFPAGDNLPFAATDFVLPALGETWGILVCLVVILAYLIAMRSGIAIARFASDNFSRLAASGLILIILFQAIINVGVGLALLPVKGMPLPFVSAGGSNLITTCIMLGILWRIRSEALHFHASGETGDSAVAPGEAALLSESYDGDAPATENADAGRGNLEYLPFLLSHSIDSRFPMIPQHYPIEEGKLYGGEYPGHRDPDVAKVRLRCLIALGISTFVDLTAPADRMTPYEELLEELAEEVGSALRRISLPITDMGIPETGETMRVILESIRESTSCAPAVYVHCWGGIGRTGTVVGCWLRECGHDPESALAHVQHLYASHMPKVSIHPESPQTPAQKDYIRNWMTAR